MTKTGFEPATTWRHHYWITDYQVFYRIELLGLKNYLPLGFEPRLAESKPAVLTN